MFKYLVFIALLIGQIAYSQINTDYYLQQGIKDLMEKRYEGGIKRFSSVIEVKHDSWEAYFLRGIGKFYLGDNVGAELDFNQGITINAYFSELYMFRGIIYQMQNRYDKARTDYEHAISLDPVNTSIYTNKGLIELITGNYKDALTQFNKAIELDASNADAYLFRALCYSEQKNYNLAYSDFNKTLQINKFEDRVYIWRGKMKYDEKKYSESVADFDLALKVNPDNGQALYYRAIVRHDNNDLPGCLSDFDRVIALNKANTLALFNRAVIREEIGMFDSAIVDYQRVITLNPQNVLAHFNKALLEHQQNNYSAAIQDYTKAISIYPDFFYAYQNRASARMSIGDVRNANTDILKANKIKQEKRDKQYSDSTIFNKLVKFDASFDSKENEELLVVNRFLQSSSNRNFADLLIVATQSPQYRLRSYFCEYVEQLNKEYGVKNRIIITNECKMLADSVIPQMLKTKDSVWMKQSQVMRGVLAGLNDNYNTAQSIFDSILAKDPNNIAALFNRAWVNAATIAMLASLEDVPQEVSVFSKKLTMQVNVKSASKKSNKMLNNQYDAVLQDYTRVIELDSTFYPAYYNRATILCRNYNYSAAVTDFSRSIARNSQLAPAYLNRGLAYLYLSDTSNACIDFSKAGELGIKDVYPLLRSYCKQ